MIRINLLPREERVQRRSTMQWNAGEMVIPVGVVVATLLIPQNILFEAALSFLAVGVPAGTPSWGGMLSDATNGALYRIAWWMLFFPGMFLVMTTLAFNLLGDGLRDALDPRAGR